MTNASTDNFFSVGFYSGALSIDDQSSAPTNVLLPAYAGMITGTNEPFKTLVFAADNLHKKACYYDGATNVNVPEVCIFPGSGVGIYNKYQYVAINADYLDITDGGVGCFVNTEINKTFVIKRDVVTGYGGRVFVRCYDSGGTVLTSAGAGHPYVKGTQSNALSWATSSGGGYRTGSNAVIDTVFVVGADVKKIFVGIMYGSAPGLRIRGFQLYTTGFIDTQNGVMGYSGLDPVKHAVNRGTAAPSAGTWEVGRIVWNDVPAAGGIEKWECTVAGTPGTWVPSGIVGAIQGVADSDSTATDVAGLKADFNDLLAKLRTAKLIAT